MNIAGWLALLVAIYCCGNGIIRLVGLVEKPLFHVLLSLVVGIPVISLAPLLVQLCKLPIDALWVAIAIVVLCAVVWLPQIKKIRMPKFSKIPLPNIYEAPLLLIIGFLLVNSAWRCFYYPPLPRDLVTGPELIAEYAIREKTLINSVYDIDLSTTNNYLKSPFITGLQIVYKLFVCPFGQVWLSILAFSFYGILYILLRQKIHPLFAAFLMLLFVTIPDIYAYTYLVLYDFSEMVFFFLGFYYLLLFTGDSDNKKLVFSAILFGFAVYIRAETLILVFLMLPIVVYPILKQSATAKQKILQIGMFVGIPVICYLICVDVFVRLFVPVQFNVSDNLNHDLLNITPFFVRLFDIGKELIFCQYGVDIFAWFIFFFLIVLITDALVFRNFGKEALLCIYAIAIVYIGMAFIGYLIPLADLLNTTKRGLFRFAPIMLLYMRYSKSLLWATEKIGKWELSI